MFISDLAIRRPLVTVVTMLALVAFGLVALLRLKTDEFPDVVPPFVEVTVAYPGASPPGVEKELLDPIEEKIAAVGGVKHVTGRAYDGYATGRRRVRLRPRPGRGDAGDPRRRERDPRRPPCRDQGAARPQDQQRRPPHRVARPRLQHAVAGRTE
jgi:hypothetical protein